MDHHSDLLLKIGTCIIQISRSSGYLAGSGTELGIWLDDNSRPDIRSILSYFCREQQRPRDVESEAGGADCAQLRPGGG